MILWYLITSLLCAFSFVLGAIIGRNSMMGDE